MTAVVDDASLLTAAHTLLADARARIAAIADTGLFVDCPAEWPVERPRLPGKSLLDSVVAADQQRIIETWERARKDRAATVVVRSRLGTDGPDVAVHFLDVRHEYGVWLGALVASEIPASTDEPATDRGGDEVWRPRFARVRKDQLAVILDIDDATSQLLGWSRDDMVGHRSLEFVHPDDHEVAIGSWIELLSNPGLGRRVRLRHLRKDGSYGWFELTNNNLLDDESFGHVATDMLDVSEEMAATEALRAREQLLQRLTESLPVGIVQVDAGGQVVFANAPLTGWLGRSPADLDGLLSGVEPADLDAAGRAFRSVLEGEEQGEAEIQLTGVGARHCSLVVRRLTEADGATSGAVGCFSDVTDSLRLRRELHRQAMRDPLTGVFNRAGISESLDAAWEEPGRGIAVMFADLDTFKAVNDSFGHEVGDRLLVMVTDMLRRHCRTTDMIGRMGGDEFLVLCADIDRIQAEELRDRIQAAVSHCEFDLPDGSFTWSASVGLAWSDGSAHGRNLVAESDADMYAVKMRRRLQDSPGMMPVQREQVPAADVGPAV